MGDKMTDWIELTHPGEDLAEVLEDLGMTPYRLAKSIGVPQDRIGKILKGQRGITPDTSTSSSASARSSTAPS